MRRREFIAFLGGTAALSALPRAAAALDYPTRPVHWIVGFPPGGATDIIARLMGQWLSDRLGRHWSSTIGRAPAAISAPKRSPMRAPPQRCTTIVCGTALWDASGWARG
jgi:hypothetical protein